MGVVVEPEQMIIERWHGTAAKADAWQACHTAAAIVTKHGLARRYGVKVDRRRYVNGRFREIEYRLILVDRQPDQARPARVERLFARTYRDRLQRLSQPQPYPVAA